MQERRSGPGTVGDGGLAGGSGGKLIVARTTDKEQALIRIYWESGRTGLYGETRGGDVYVRPDPGEGLTRETMVYLTCLHETGHALGLSSYGEFEDIMYNFQYGGDIRNILRDITRKLVRREDIRKIPGISPNDRETFSCRTVSRFLYPCGRQSFILTGHY